MATFEIGSQNAASIQNIEGDVTIGELRVEAAWSAVDLRRELAGFENQLAGVALPPASRAAVEGTLAAAVEEAARPAADPGRIAELLQRATLVLGEAGALTTAGTGLVEGLRRTGALLGPAGKALLALLPLV
jgi:hypothetical protein